MTMVSRRNGLVLIRNLVLEKDKVRLHYKTQLGVKLDTPFEKEI